MVFVYEKNAVVCSRQRKKSRHLQDMVIAPSYPDQFLSKPFFVADGVYSLNLFILLLQNFVNSRNYEALNGACHVFEHRWIRVTLLVYDLIQTCIYIIKAT